MSRTASGDTKLADGDGRLLPDQRQRGFNWPAVVTLAGALGLVGLTLLHMLPDHHEAILFGAYAVPSHMLISPFPIEPPLLYLAKSHEPLLIAMLASLGSLLAGCFDFLLLRPFLSHDKVRSRYKDTRIYRKASRFFLASPFLFLVVAHLTPIPFYPFKLLSIAAGYRFWKYEAAIVLGRVPRYIALAWFGHALQLPDWMLAGLAIALVIAFVSSKTARDRVREVARTIRTKLARRSGADEQA
jgi:membrane protein YqaA with SNARE-associated domain